MKKILKVLTLLAAIICFTSKAHALEVIIKGYGGITYQNGIAKICPNQSTDDCVTIIISGSEIVGIIIHSKEDNQVAEKLMKEFTVTIANTEVLSNNEVNGCDIVIILKRKQN